MLFGKTWLHVDNLILNGYFKELGQLRRANRVYRRELDPLNTYTENEPEGQIFGRAGIEYIVNLVKDEISPNTRRSYSLSASTQVLLTLRFLSSGSFLEVIGDTFYSVDKSTVSRVVCRVTLALAAKAVDFIKFPSSRAVSDEIKQGLFRIGGFPCGIGCIDGTHVRILAPSENEPDYVNRKGFHSINVQAICDYRGITQ